MQLHSAFMNTNDIAFLLTMASFVLPTLKDVQTKTSQELVAQALVAQLDPPRVKSVRTGATYTVRHPSGQLLRGIAIGSYRYRTEQGESAHLRDPNYWAELKASGINAIRLVAFDAWQRSHGAPGSKTPYPYTDLSNAQQTAAMLAEFDLIVDQASAHGMVVMLNYHDVGGVHDPDYSKPADANGNFQRARTWYYALNFWTIVAPRYANRTHVFYELLNEPVQWRADDYSPTHVRLFKNLHDRVRALAPRTHIVVCSFATHFSSPGRSMRDVAFELRNAGIDFRNASIGFHPYNDNFPDGNHSGPVLELMKSFAAINTEQNFPAGMVAGSADPDASGMDGDHLGVQSMERLRTSWFHWNSDTIDEFRTNFRGKVIPDARRKGYFWMGR